MGSFSPGTGTYLPRRPRYADNPRRCLDQPQGGGFHATANYLRRVSITDTVRVSTICLDKNDKPNKPRYIRYYSITGARELLTTTIKYRRGEYYETKTKPSADMLEERKWRTRINFLRESLFLLASRPTQERRRPDPLLIR